MTMTSNIMGNTQLKLVFILVYSNTNTKFPECVDITKTSLNLIHYSSLFYTIKLNRLQFRNSRVPDHRVLPKIRDFLQDNLHIIIQISIRPISPATTI
jgi:hypothetical protein